MDIQNEFKIGHQGGDEVEGKYLTFWTDGQLFGIPIGEVIQTIEMQQITELPEFPAYVQGVITLRGHIIPVIDMRLRFGKAKAPYTNRTCIIISHVLDTDFGLIVDEVSEVTDILPEFISPLPKIKTDKVHDYLTGIAQLVKNNEQRNRVVLLIHTGKILCEDEFLALAQAAQQ